MCVEGCLWHCSAGNVMAGHFPWHHFVGEPLMAHVWEPRGIALLQKAQQGMRLEDGAFPMALLCQKAVP